MVQHNTITTLALHKHMEAMKPDNEHRSVGYALVNVLSAESFAARHIVGSINIPADNEEEFERRFDKDKEIIVYCASPKGKYSPTVAIDLVKRGFTNVTDYEDGLSEWIHEGYPVEGDDFR